MNKREKQELAIGGGALTGAGLLAFGSKPKPKIVRHGSIHAYDEIKSLPRTSWYENPFSSLMARPGDIYAYNDAELAKFHKKTKTHGMYFAIDQSDANNRIGNAPDVKKYNLGIPSEADVIVGSKGIRAQRPGQIVIEEPNIPISKKLKKHISSITSQPSNLIPQVGLTFGTKNQAELFLGPQNSDVSKIHNIIGGLDKHYGKGKYQLEVFGGRDKEIQRVLQEGLKPYSHVRVSGAVKGPEFYNRIFKKDLLFTNPGLITGHLTQSKIKVPTIVVAPQKVTQTKQLNAEPNTKWLLENHPPSRMLFSEALPIEENTAKAIKEVTSLPRTGKPVTFTGEATKNYISNYMKEETARRGLSKTRLPHLNKLEKFMLPTLLATSVIAGGKYIYDKQKHAAFPFDKPFHIDQTRRVATLLQAIENAEKTIPKMPIGTSRAELVHNMHVDRQRLHNLGFRRRESDLEWP